MKQSVSDYSNDSIDDSDGMVTLPDTEACLICSQTVCCICERHLHSLLLPEIVLIIENLFFFVASSINFSNCQQQK